MAADEKKINDFEGLSHEAIRERYKKINPPTHCEICNVVEWLGYPIPLRLDHIDGNHNNNSLNNLRWICHNCDSQLDTYCGKNNKYLEHNQCKDCGCKITRGATRCAECHLKHITKKPTKDDLKTCLRTSKTQQQVAEHYGVTRGAVRFWCNDYNLPFNFNEINQYSDDEWRQL